MEKTKEKVKRLMEGEVIHFRAFSVYPEKGGYLIASYFRKGPIHLCGDLDIATFSSDFAKFAEEMRHRNKFSLKEKYFYVEGNEVRQAYFNADKFDMNRIAVGNVFKTEVMAEKNKRKIMEMYETAWEKYVRDEHKLETV